MGALQEHTSFCLLTTSRYKWKEALLAYGKAVGCPSKNAGPLESDVSLDSGFSGGAI